MCTKKSGNEFVVGDVLQFGDDDVTSLLKDDFIVPRRIQGAQATGDAIVFSSSERVHHSQLALFGETGVVAHETGAVGAWRRNSKWEATGAC